jgi:hypothetical protein
MSDFVRTRDRMSGTANSSNERIGRGVDSDFTGLTSADGFVTIINKSQGRSFVWVGQCSKPGCMCSGFTFTHEYLVNGNPLKCPASSHDRASSEPVVRRTYAEAGVQERMRDDIVLSPRARAEAAASQAARELFEKENQ